ncbi:MAG TPA: 2-oxoacid:acceptor oxidoreductase family protein [Candidatus Bathyarchaeia archaeon]|nr:2-oxoacid:acceptor oxidoreductase family protein [Candidatus Bathyarchaeia archaeon]
MLFETVMSGFGGQGVMYMGDLLGQAGIAEGRNATFFPTYGVAMRGGTANCVVVISDEEIGSPLLDEPDGAILMNQQSLVRFQSVVKKGGLIVGNSSILKPETCTRNGDVRTIWIPATEISREVTGNERSGNIVAFGAFLNTEPVVKIQTAEKIFRGLAGRKKDMIEKNLAALHAGIEYAARAG